MSEVTREEKVIFRAVSLALALVIVAIWAIIYYSSIKSSELTAFKKLKSEKIESIDTALNDFHKKRWYYPTPDDSLGILAWKGEIIVWQGLIGDSLIKKLNLSESIKLEKFIYTTTNNGDKYSLWYVFSDGKALIKGDNIGLFTDNNFKPIDWVENPIDDLSDLKNTVNVFFDSGFKIKLKNNDASLIKAIPVYGYDDSLLAYWDMETLNSKGLMYDLSWNWNNWNVKNTILGQVEWVVGKSAWFDGKTSYITSKKLAQSIAKTEKFTISYLIKNSTSSNFYDKTHFAINSDKLDWKNDVVFRVLNWADVWTKQNKGALALSFSNSRIFEKWKNLNNNEWHLITFTVDRTAEKTVSNMFIDGEYIGKYTLKKYKDWNELKTEENLDKATHFSVGQDYDKKDWKMVTSDFYKGLIDEFRVYSRILTKEEISDLAEKLIK